MLFGFAFSSAAATEDVGGFGLGDLTSSLLGDAGGLPGAFDTFPVAAPAPSLVAAPATVLPLVPHAAATQSTSLATAPIACAATLRADDWIASDTWPWVMALMGWAALTHLGLRRIRRETGDDS
jgi:hypothetical protein